ncbi:ankyrin repeat domain-containing protein [Trinickia acidisoli]|uniref:ankyrin repeat domain-containing protein n=1 Tax=Trinickia acidisoli TaxID=2767482 RepID=UPI001A8D681A|nr:ankyrin repeat domain-containing protein [Trinickia acidisoli]
MKITFKEGGDFQVEQSDGEQAHIREAATAKAEIRYGEQPVYFDALKHGSFSSFEQSPEYGASTAQIRKSLDSLRQFLDRKQSTVNQAASAQIDEFGKRVESGSTGFFSTRVALAHSMGKEALEQLAFNVENPQNDEERREVTLKNLAPELIACADGAIDQLVRRARLLELESAGGLKFNARSEWEKMLTQSILEFAQERFGLRQNYRNNEIHYHNGLWNHLASHYGMAISADGFVPSLSMTDADFEACERHVMQQVTPGRLVHHVAENCLGEIRGHFHAFADRPLATDEVVSFYAQFENWALTELEERFGVVPPAVLFVSSEDENEETVYRMVHDPALLMETIGESLVKSRLLNEFPVHVVQERGRERILQLAYQAFVVNNATEKQNRSLTIADLDGLGDGLTPQMVLAALRNTPEHELAAIPADRMTDLLETERTPLAWLSHLSDSTIRNYRDSRAEAEAVLFTRIPEKMRALGGVRQELALLGAAKAGDESLAAYLAGGFPTVRGFDGQGNAALHYAASQQMLRVIERLGGKLDFNVRNLDNRTPLMLAAQNGHAAAVHALVEKGADVELTRTDGATALMIAAAHDKRGAMKALLDVGANRMRIDNNGWGVLLIAAAHNGAGAIAELAEGGFDMEQATPAGVTALMLAARYGCVAAIESLARERVNPNRTAAQGVTALMCASQYGHAAAIDPLVNLGADPNLATQQRMTAAMLAARNGHAAALDKLAERGANLEMTDNEGMTALLLAVTQGKAAAVEALTARRTNRANPNCAGPDGMTALLHAAKAGDPAIVETLLKAGADMSRTDNDGCNAVMVAAINDRAAAIEKLAAVAPDVNFDLDLDAINSQGRTALMLAAGLNCAEAIRMLASKGINVHLGDGDGRSALMIAADNGHVEALEALFAAGANVAQRDAHGMTALMHCTSSYDTDAIKVLLDHGADTEDADPQGMTALIIAACDGNADVMEALLDGHAVVDRRDNEGRTALMHAAREGRSEAVALLLDYSADFRLVDNAGRSALAHAVEHEHHEAADELRGHGADDDTDGSDSKAPSTERSDDAALSSPGDSPGKRGAGDGAAQSSRPSSSAEPSAKRRRF